MAKKTALAGAVTPGANRPSDRCDARCGPPLRGLGFMPLPRAQRGQRRYNRSIPGPPGNRPRSAHFFLRGCPTRGQTPSRPESGDWSKSSNGGGLTPFWDPHPPRPRKLMPAHDDSKLAKGRKSGEKPFDAADFERFTRRLIGLARAQLDDRLQHKIEPEDVVQ